MQMLRILRHSLRNIQTSARLSGWRFALSSLLSHNLGLNVTDNPFNDDNYIVVLAPHPDDEVLGCAGALMKAHHAKVIYLTDGRHGTPSGKVDGRLVPIRKKEAINGLKVLNPHAESVFLKYSDSDFRPTKIIARQVLDEIINYCSRAQARERRHNSSRPLASNNIMLFVPWFLDDNPDHQATAKLVKIILSLATDLSIKEIWQYEVWSPLVPNRLVPLSGAAIRHKGNAIGAHKSQLKAREYDKAILGLNAYRGAIASLKSSAEAYLALSPKEFIDFTKQI